MTITPTIRFAAHDRRRTLREAGDTRLAAAISRAAYAESFPHSYTPAATAVATDILAAAARGDMAALTSGADAIDELDTASNWYGR